MNYKPLEKRLAYVFNDKSLLQRALTHASKSVQHLERQEFLGDAVLGLVIAEALFHRFPDAAEGELSKMRAKLVCKQALLDIAQMLKLANFLDVGCGERDPEGGLKSASIAANAVEAVIGAVFQDASWQQAQAVVQSMWQHKLEQIHPHNLRDAKSKLQEITQAHGMGLPSYGIQDLGAYASPRFKAQCILNHVVLGIGDGERKKEAELQAAAAALEHPYVKEVLLKV